MNLWFTEDLEIARGLRQQIQIASTIHSEQSPYQKIDILETTDFGRLLVLDNVVMLTEGDEFCYHEMITHVPLFAHPAPARILIIGGGDGGAIRETVKHPTPEEIHLCEIDRRVVELSQEYFPAISSGFSDPRVRVHFEDGRRWLEGKKELFDLILVDSTDPIGMARALFEFEFYELCRGALAEGGILVTQAENFFLHQEIVGELMDFGRRLFPICRYYYTIVPTYPGGMIGFTFFSEKSDPFSCVEGKLQKESYRRLVESLRYWNPGVHRGAFELPVVAKKIVYNS